MPVPAQPARPIAEAAENPHDKQGAERAGQRAQEPVHDGEHGQVHERHQGLHVLEARLGEGVVEHGEAGDINLDVGKRGVYFAGQAPGVGGHLRHLGDALSGQVQRHVDAGHVRRRGNEAVDQQGFVQGNLPGFQQGLGRLCGGVGHQVGHEQVVALGAGVLEVGDRVDTDGIGNLPRLLRQALDGGQHLGGKDLAAGRRQDEQDVVVLAVDVLQFLEGLELRVVLAEEHAVVGIEPQKAPAAGGGGHQQHGDQHDEPAPANHPPAIGLYCAVKFAVFWHGVSLQVASDQGTGCQSGRR